MTGEMAYEGEPRRYLIATAISRYAKCPEWNRPGLVEARERVIDVFTRRLGYKHETALGLDPTRSQLTDQLRAFCTAQERREDDLLAVYISGHGEVLEDDGEHVLFASDTDPADVTYTALPTVQLARAMLRDTQVRRLLLVLDTCYSGQGGNELAAAALGRLKSADWLRSTESGLVVVSSAQPHQQAETGVFPRLLADAVEAWATAGHGPQTLAVSSVVQRINDHPDRPSYQRVNLSLIGLAGEPPPFMANPRHAPRLTSVDLAIQQAAKFDEQAQRRETELTRRLLVRAMGHSKDWWFSGRRAALADVTRWLNAPVSDSTPTCQVVTAGPGSGKTAILGLIAACSDDKRRRTVPLDALGLSDRVIPQAGALNVSLYVQNLTDSDVLQGLAAAARVKAATVGELLEALGTRHLERPFTALVDALDEAATPHTLCSRVLRPLIEHSNGRIRLLLGTRPYLLDRLVPSHRHTGSNQVIDLDNPRYADPEAIKAYTIRNLLEATLSSPYRLRPETTLPVAEAVAAAAGTSFLVARITAATLAAADHVVPDPGEQHWRDTLPRLPGPAMQDDLTSRLGDHAQRAMDLLRPLAFAEGQGLPWENIWAPLASEISGNTYTDDDLLWLRETAGSYVVEATEAGRSAYRLYHQALAEYLREGTDPPTVHAAYTRVLTSKVPYRSNGTRDWSRAHPYTLNYLAAHATAARLLDDILLDTEYLTHAAPRRLMPHLNRTRTEAGRLVAAVYRSAVDVHATTTPARRRQRLALDAARACASGLHQRLISQMEQGVWAPQWATGNDFSPNLRDILFSPALRDSLQGNRHGVASVASTVLEGIPVIVAGSYDGTVRIWDLATGTQFCEPLTGHTDSAAAVAITELGGQPIAVTGSHDYTVRIWDLTTGAQHGEALTGHTDHVTAVACTVVSGTPITVTGSRDKTVRVWDLTTHAQIGKPLTGHTDEVNEVACTAVNGTPVAVTAGDDGTVRVWDLTTHAQIGEPLTGHTDQVAAVACTVVSGTPIAVTGSRDKTVRVWDLTTHAQIGKPLTGHHTGGIWSITCTTLNGTPIALTAGADGTVRLWDLTTHSQVGDTLKGHTGWAGTVTCAAVNGVSVAVSGGQDGTVRIWDIDTGIQSENPRVHQTSWVLDVACTVVNGVPAAVAAGADKTVRIWDLTTGIQIGEPLTGHTEWVWAVACTVVNGAPVAVTGSGDRSVRVWDLTTGTQIGEPLTGHTEQVGAVACTVVNGTPVAVTGSGDSTVRVWDLATGTQIGEPLTGHTEWVRAVACTVVNRIPVAVTGGDDGTVRVWDLTTGTQIGEPLTDEWVRSIACATVDDIPVAVTGSTDWTIRIWNLATRTQIGEPLTGHTDWVSSVACTVVNGTPAAVTGSGDRTVRIWELRTGRSTTLSVPAVGSLALSDQGHLVLGTGKDVAVYCRRP
ncbi:caspase family protein [Streptomyces althioticus]|uniref:caspase family protein n=1 Tax=Streptomyces althioticus TaxID=83380 RepID=UPI0036F12506